MRGMSEDYEPAKRATLGNGHRVQHSEERNNALKSRARGDLLCDPPQTG